MKTRKIAYSAQQLDKISQQLGVLPSTPPENITKPAQMRSKVFQIRLARFEKHQKRTVSMINDGLNKWYTRRYHF